MPHYTYPLAAIRDDGSVIIAATPDEAAAFNRLRPGPKHVHGLVWISMICNGHQVWRESVTRHKWIVRDAYGDVVLHEDLPRTDAPRAGWLRRRLVEAQEAAARGLPIPHTGRRGRYSHGYRDFAINIAARAAEAALNDDLAEWGVDGHQVGRRRSAALPQAWDDVEWRARRCCWKDNRRRQWRENA